MTRHAGIIDLFVCLIFPVGIGGTASDPTEGRPAPGGFTAVTHNGAKYCAARSTNGCPAHDAV